MSRRALLAVALLALFVRVGWELQVTGADGPQGVLARHLLGDERAYDALARDFAEDRVERDRAYYQEPLYAWLLGQLYELWPPADLGGNTTAVPHDSVHRAVIWTQHGLGVLLCLVVALLGARTGGPVVGGLAGVLAALSAPVVFHEAQLLKATLGLLVFTTCLLLWLDLLQPRDAADPPRGLARLPRPARAALLGALLGVGLMLRGNLYLLLGFVLLSLVVPLGTPRRRPLEAGIVLLAALLAVSPLTLANLRRGEFVLSTYQAATNVAIGQPDDGDPTSGIIYAPLRAGRGDALFEERDAVGLAEAAVGRRLSGPEVSEWWWTEVRRRLVAHPAAAAQRVALKLLHVVHGNEVPDVKDVSFQRRAAPWSTTPLSDLRWFGAWGLLGALLLPWRRRPDLLVLRLGLLTVAITLGAFFVMGRYRLTAAPCLWILAAALLHHAWQRRAEWSRAAQLALLAALVGLPWWFATLDLPSDVGGDHVSYANAAAALRRDAEAATDPVEAAALRDLAVEWSREAVRIAPRFPSAHTGLVNSLGLSTPLLQPRLAELPDAVWRLLLLLEGLRVGAEPPVAALQAPLPQVIAQARALAERPSTPAGRDYVGPLLPEALVWVSRTLDHDPVEALAVLDRAVQLDPEEELAHARRGRLLRAAGRPAEAVAAYERAIALGLTKPEVFNNLGNALRDLGRRADALAAYDRALALAPGHPGVLANRARAEALPADDP